MPRYFETFLLVLLLSMGTVILAQEATPPPAPAGRVAFIVEETPEGLGATLTQVNNTCVPPVFGRYELRLKVPEAQWATKIADVPPNLSDHLELGNFPTGVWAFNSYSQKRNLVTGLGGMFLTNEKPRRGLYLMVPDFYSWRTVPSATCGPATDLWEIPVRLVGGDPEPGALKGAGTALKSIRLDDGILSFEVVAYNPSDILVFQETEFDGKPYTYQRSFVVNEQGVHKFEVPLTWLMKYREVKIHIRDRRSNVSWTTNLLGGGAIPPQENGHVYNRDIARYCSLFTGKENCALRTKDVELRSRSAEEPPNLDWFWELTGQATRRR